MEFLDRLRKGTQGSTADPGAPTTGREATDAAHNRSGARGRQDRYRAVDIAVLPCGEAETLVYARGTHTPRVLEAFETAVLQQCDRFRTLDEHATEITTALGLDGSEKAPVRDLLEALRSDGLLWEHGALCRRTRAAASDSGDAAITTLAITTCDRPRLLGRLLESCVEAGGDTPGTRDLLVLDDSRNETSRAQNQTLAQGFGARTGARVRYLGPGEKRAVVRALARGDGGERFETSLLEHALLDPHHCRRTLGANRNAMLLAQVGEVLLCADDDTTSRLAPTPGSSGGLALSSDLDVTQLWFHADADRALAMAPLEAANLFSQHGRLLGRSPGACLEAVAPGDDGAVSLSGASPSLIRMIASGRGRVRVTVPGVVGDSGMGGTSYYLGLQGPGRQRLLSEFATHRTTRGLLRAATRHTLTDSPFLMTPQAGLDNREVLPPFFPVGRNSDGLFGLTLRSCLPEGLIAHLPYAIDHAPPDARRVTSADLASFPATLRISDVVEYGLRSCRFGPAVLEPEDRLDELGRHLQGLGRLSRSDFVELICLQRWQARGALATHLDRLLTRYDALPEAWAADVEALLEQLHERVFQVATVAPTDLPRDSDDERIAMSQHLLFRFGEVLQAWPSLVNAARRLREQGRLTRPLE